MSKLVKLRHQAYCKQGGRCYYCNLPIWDGPDESEFAAKHRLTTALARLLKATAEHLKAQQDGGADVPGNIAAACHFCNLRRHAGRQDSAPSAKEYRKHVQERIAVGKWHPAVQHLKSKKRSRN
ncbi:HNH endonuclease [Acidovorax delafieldii]|uniref:HNH endonuclease n=1 Tax=Acidovorax delafieldii TaxID=47920 RepID=UPI003ECC55AA